MKFKARYLMEHEVTVEAQDAHHAAELLTRSLEGPVKLLGVIPQNTAWADRQPPAPRPPRNTPPSGSPGTPTVNTPPEVAHAVAA